MEFLCYAQVAKISFCSTILFLDYEECNFISYSPVGNYMFKGKIVTLKQGVKYAQKLTRRPERRRFFIVNFEHISHLVLVFLLLTLSR